MSGDVKRNLSAELAEAHTALARATARLDEAILDESRAMKAAISARNAVNCAQKEFDVLIAEIKRSAPGDSNWARENLPKVRLPVTETA